MSKSRRILDIIVAAVMVFCSVIMFIVPDAGYQLVLLILEISLLFNGVRLLYYYFSMARYKVGGISYLYKGIIYIDAGLFALNLHNVPQAFAMLYLIATHVISGGKDILQANQARKMEAGHWRYQLVYGIIKIGGAITCLFFINSTLVVTYLYAIGLLHSAVTKVITALRKSAVVYVQ